MELHRAGEDYLKAILMLQKKDSSVRSLDVARALHVTKPSVSKAMKRLREGGYLTMDAAKRINLTEVGREIAEQATEKHRVLTSCLLSMGIDPIVAERDACALEHAISSEALEQMQRFIDRKGGVS